MMYKRRIIWLFLFLCFVHTTSFTQEYSLLQMYSSAQRILREGVSNGDVDKIQEALILFNRSLEINPNYFDVLKDLSIGYFMLGDMHLARTYMESALRQNSEDTNLRILKIFLDMKDGDLKIAKDQIDEISRRFPLKIEVAYLQMMYAALLNDRDKIDEIYSSMISRFGNDNRFVYLFTVIQSLEDKKISFEQDSIVNEIDLLYPQQPWVQWLLAEYNFASKNSEAEQRIVDYLLTVKIPELEKYAQQRRFINAFNQKDYLQATSYAEDYTEKISARD